MCINQWEYWNVVSRKVVVVGFFLGGEECTHTCPLSVKPERRGNAILFTCIFVFSSWKTSQRSPLQRWTPQQMTLLLHMKLEGEYNKLKNKLYDFSPFITCLYIDCWEHLTKRIKVQKGFTLCLQFFSHFHGTRDYANYIYFCAI